MSEGQTENLEEQNQTTEEPQKTSTETENDTTQNEIEKKITNKEEEEDLEEEIWGDTTHRYLFMSEEEGATKQQKTLAVCVILTQFFIYLAIWISAEIQGIAFNKLSKTQYDNNYNDIICQDKIMFASNENCAANTVTNNAIFTDGQLYNYDIQFRIDNGECPYPGEAAIGIGVGLLVFFIFVAPGILYIYI